MASQDPEEPLNTETEEETIAIRKKRLRRVSFADREITSVHIFNRDEDYETPPDSSAAKRSSEAEETEVLNFFSDLAPDSDGELKTSVNEDEDDDDETAAGKFFQPFESPSPGSSTIGSGTSHDDNNFFGPVSASFIRPRRLDDSAASDDNNDITMDSTAFSLHFRSLARSESGDLKTPTGVRMGFEESTPSQASPSDSGSSMVLMKSNKPLTHTSPLVRKVTGSRDSNDMSLLGDNSSRFDYGRLSSELEALLAEGSDNLHSSPDFKSAFQSKSLKRRGVPVSTENGNGNMDMKENRDTSMHDVTPANVHIGASAVHSKMGEVNGSSTTTLMDQVCHQSNENDNPTVDTSVGYHIQTPNQMNKIDEERMEVMRDRSMLNGELSACSGNLLDAGMNNCVHQLNLPPQPKHADDSSTEDLLIKSFLNDGEHDFHIDKLPDKSGSPLANSMTVLSAEKELNSLDAANSSRHLLYVTPSPKKNGSSFSTGNMELGEILSSIQKNNSKFKIYSSPRKSALKDEIEKSRRRLQEHLYPETSPLKSASKSLRCQNLDGRIRNLEKQLFATGTEDHRKNISVGSTGHKKSKNFDTLNQNEETLDLVNDARSLQSLSFCTGKVTEIMKAAALPSQLSRSPKKVMQHPSTSDPMEEASVISGSDSLLAETLLVQSKDQKETTMFHKVVSPSVGQSHQSLSSSVEYQKKLSGDLKQHGHRELVAVGSGGHASDATTAHESHLTVLSDRLNSLLGEQLNSVIENDNVKTFAQSRRADDREPYSPDLQGATGIIRNSHTPGKDINSLNFKLQKPEINLQITTEPIMNKENLMERGIEDSSYVPASPNVQRQSVNDSSPLQCQNVKKSLIQSPLKEPTGSPCTRELFDSSFRDHIHQFVRKDGVLTKSNVDEHGGDDLQCLQDFENCSGQKRRSEDIVFRDADDAHKSSSIQRSPKVHKSGRNEAELKMENLNGSHMRNVKIGGERILKQWTDISQKFSTETNHILSSLVDKLNIRAIEVLEDIIIHMLRSKRYETFCSDIHSRKLYNQSSDITHQRVAESRLLLYKIVYEKARLQLMHVKHGCLLKRGQLLNSGVQNCEIMKLNYVRHLSTPGDIYTQIEYTHSHPSSVNSEGKNKVDSEKLTAMRQEVETSDRKIMNLIKSFHTSHKMKGELSCADTIVLLKDSLKKKIRCRSLRQHLQLWKINDLEQRNGRHSLVISYCNFICQRFSIIADVSSMIISNELNNTNIMKKFPNMDAYIAFVFVFDDKFTKKAVGLKSFAQETQITSSLLRTLLAVIEEVQQARIEIRNLVEARFNSPSARQLVLQLSFIDFSHGRKAAIALDLTSLNCGIYPSDTLPYQLQAPSKSLSTEIKAATGSLSVGHLRIIRLCRCVSLVMQSSNR